MLPQRARFITASLVLVGLIVRPTPLFAADYQQCNQGNTCTLGEFLYDDSYTPIASASCSLNTHDPSGNLLLGGAQLSAHSDGWYDYNIDTATLSAGVYRSELCCDTGSSEHLCIDKSFSVTLPDLSASDLSNAVWNATMSAYVTPGTFGYQVQNPPTLDPSQIWSYPNRTLSGFGSLVSDIWSYSTRSLTSFGTLVSDIWNHTDRTLTSQNLDNVATTGDLESSTNSIKNDITNKTDSIQTQLTSLQTTLATMSGSPLDNDTLAKIYSQVLENRNLLDAVVNQPIVQTLVEDGGTTPDLSQKLNQTDSYTQELFASTQQVVSRLGVLNLKLPQMTVSAVNTELAAIEKLIQDPNSDKSAVTGHVAWLHQAWGNQLTQNLTDTSSTLLNSLKQTQSSLLGSATTSPASSDLNVALDAAKSLEDQIGDISNSSTDPTLFGFTAKVKSLAQSLDQNDQALADILTRWNQEPLLSRQKQIATLQDRVMAVNQLSNAQSLIDHQGLNPDELQKNTVLGLKAVTGINRLLLAQMAGSPVSSIWLEEGSVIFRVLITNPSQRISQTVPVKFALPREIKEEDIIKADPELTVNYDPTQGTLVGSGNFTLNPGETKTFAIEVTDIFKISTDLIGSLKSQAEQLLKPLENTAYYGQGATLKSDIDVALNKILDRQNTTQTPESRIRAYRESQIELAGVRDKLDQLKTLVTGASATNSIFGFVGGIQAAALWGIVIIVIAGFVFLTVYLRILRRQAYEQVGGYGQAATTALSPGVTADPDYLQPKTSANPAWPTDLIKRYLYRMSHGKPALPLDSATRFFQIVFVILTTTVFTVIVITTIMYNPTPKSASNPLSQAQPSPPPPQAVLGQSTINLTPTADKPLELLTAPSPEAKLITSLTAPITATVLKEENGYRLIELPASFTPQHAWIKSP